jgi:hypothetical protein
MATPPICRRGNCCKESAEMEAGPARPGQSSRRLLWGVIVAVVVVAIAGVGAILWLRSGEERVTVPDVVALSAESAETVLEAAGLVLGDVKRVRGR